MCEHMNIYSDEKPLREIRLHTTILHDHRLRKPYRKF
nr:MAG TPA: hypothetical protein [Caudoviricetes sp.]